MKISRDIWKEPEKSRKKSWKLRKLKVWLAAEPCLSNHLISSNPQICLTHKEPPLLKWKTHQCFRLELREGHLSHSTLLLISRCRLIMQANRSRLLPCNNRKCQRSPCRTCKPSRIVILNLFQLEQSTGRRRRDSVGTSNNLETVNCWSN